MKKEKEKIDIENKTQTTKTPVGQAPLFSDAHSQKENQFEYGNRSPVDMNKKKT